MLKNTRVLGAVVIGAAVGLLLGGCTSGSQAAPTAAPTVVAAPTSVASPSASSVESEPAPSPTVERNRDTAKQFIIDYFEAYEEAFRSADPRYLDILRTKECGKCELFAADIKKLQADGARWPQAAVEVLPFVSQQDPDPDLMQWEVQYKSDLGRKEMRDGSRGESAKTVQRSILVEVKYLKGQWMMNGVATGDGGRS